MPKKKKMPSKNLKIFLSALAVALGFLSLYSTNPLGLSTIWGNALILLGFAGFAWVIFGD